MLGERTLRNVFDAGSPTVGRFNFFFNPPVHLCAVTYNWNIVVCDVKQPISLTHSQLKLSPLSWKSVKLTVNLSNVYNTYRIESVVVYILTFYTRLRNSVEYTLSSWVAYVSKLIKINNNDWYSSCSQSVPLTKVPYQDKAYLIINVHIRGGGQEKREVGDEGVGGRGEEGEGRKNGPKREGGKKDENFARANARRSEKGGRRRGGRGR